MSSSNEGAPRPTRSRPAVVDPAESVRAPRRRTADERPGTRWLWMIPLLALGLMSLLAVGSFAPEDGQAFRDGLELRNWVGPAGHGLAWLMFHATGVAAYPLALVLLGVCVLACRPEGLGRPGIRAFGIGLLLASVDGALHLLVAPEGWSYPPGGLLGEALGAGLRTWFSRTGALLLLGALSLMALLMATRFAAARLYDGMADGTASLTTRLAASVRDWWQRRRERPTSRPAARASRNDGDSDEPDLAGPDARLPVLLAPTRSEPVVRVVDPEQLTRANRGRRSRNGSAEDLISDSAPIDEPSPAPLVPPAPSAVDEAARVTEPPVLPSVTAATAVAPLGPTIVEPRKPPAPLPTDRPAAEARSDWRMKNGTAGFHIPTVDEILEGGSHGARVIDRAGLTATAAKLVQKLNNLGVQGDVTEIRPGPVVTMYEFRPADGIKLSRIASLGDDLAMAMEALRVRIVAPIPGKGVVGFEVPNRTRETVFLKEVVEQEAFQKGPSRLTMAIGKDIEGLPYVSDLAKMPHLLIAGTTGSGKSVGVNAMLVSMLMRATPEELRFIMVDPKMLELSIYDGIPHLLLPVVTDPKKAAMALRWGVEEMERRYELLAAAGVRNISQYNKFVEQKLAAGTSTTSDAAEASGEETEPLRKLPFIVIVIDELADLMMVAAKEVEVYIARLAQMARAAGIHLMVATQRPSTDVLTGVIKANFPSRISFQVASRHDSGTIINTTGAENLLGMGDMLILPPGTSSLTRVHGAYVSETEINRLTGFWKAQGAPVYDPEILRPREDEAGGDAADDEVPDELYDQAIAAVAEMKMVSISLLQRKMRIGYNRSARMIERMERDGIVGPADGAKPREVLVRRLGEMGLDA